MNADEISAVMRMIAGHWPYPAMAQEEALVLGRALAPYDVADAETAVESLALAARQYRPGPTEVCAALRSARQRRLAMADAARALPPAERTDPLPWLGRCREALFAKV